MTTPFFITGFEHGLSTISVNGNGLWNTINGAPTTQSTTKNTGSYALQCNVSATTAYVEKNYGGHTTVVGRVYFRYGTLPNTRTEILMHVGSLISGVRFMYSNTDNKIYTAFGNTGGTASSSTVTTNTWYRLDYRVVISGTTGTIDWQIDGTDQTQRVETITSGGTLGNLRMGFVTSTTANGYWDDYVLSLTSADYPIGPGGTERLAPASDGTHNNPSSDVMQDQAFNNIDGSSFMAYDKINSVPPSATTYILQNLAAANDYVEVNFANISATHSAIVGAQAYMAYSSASTTSNNGAIEISKDAWATNTVLWGDIGGTKADYSDGSTANLYYKSVIVDGVTNDTTVNALSARLGASSDATPDPYWVDVWVEVAYTTGGAPATKAPPPFQKRTHVIRR